MSPETIIFGKDDGVLVVSCVESIGAGNQDEINANDKLNTLYTKDRESVDTKLLRITVKVNSQ